MTETVWSRDDDVLTRRTSRSVLLLPADANEPLVLHGAAVVVWDAVGRAATDTQLVAEIASHLTVTADEVRAEVVAARELLCRHGALGGSRHRNDE